MASFFKNNGSNYRPHDGGDNRRRRRGRGRGRGRGGRYYNNNNSNNDRDTRDRGGHGRGGRYNNNEWRLAVKDVGKWCKKNE